MPPKCTKKMLRDNLFKEYPENIEVRPDLNGRYEKPDIEWLIADIIQHGQLEPVGIWDDGGQAVLAYGFSRRRAISEINKRKLLPEPQMLKCVYIVCNEKGAFIRNISENRQRNPTTALDDAHNIQRLFDWEMDEKDVAKVYFPIAVTDNEIKDAVKWIRERVNLIKLTPEAEKAMREGRLNETAAQAIAKLTSAQQREALKKSTGKLTAADVRNSKPKKERAAKPIPIDAELKRRLTGVLETADFESYDKNKGVWIEVNAECLVSLKNYIEQPE